MMQDKEMPTERVGKIRVLTVDDHELLRRGILVSLLSADDIEVVGEARNGAEALQMCQELQPDVVLMDMVLTDEAEGIATTRTIRSQYPGMQVLALSSFHDKTFVLGALEAGAIGYLVKGVSGKDLANAIRAAHAGQSTLSLASLQQLLRRSETTSQLGRDLTPRELEVLVLLVEGASNADIAAKLVLSVAAVRYHVSSILTKLEASNRTEAAAIARDLSLVTRK